MTLQFFHSLRLSPIAALVLSGAGPAAAQAPAPDARTAAPTVQFADASAPAAWVGRAVSYRVEVDADEAGRMQFTMRVALQRGGRARVTGCPDYASDRVRPETCLLANGVGRWSVGGQKLCLWPLAGCPCASASARRAAATP